MKRDNYKTKKQPVDELAQMRQRVAELEKSEAEHKQAEEELRESERRYRLLAENAEDVIWTVDMNMRPTYMSPSITRLLGYSVEEAMTLPMEAVYAPASFETAMKVLGEELAIENMEQKDLSRSRTLELELNRKDGSRVPVEVKFSFIRDPDGRPAKILAIARDISERKQAEEALRENEEKLQALVDGLTSTGIAIDIVSNDYKILLQNQVLVERFGDCAGKICYEEYMELEAPCDICPMREAIKSNRVESAELTGADGRSYEIFSAPLPNPDGSVDRAIEVIMDITERRRTEEALRESEERFRDLLENANDLIQSVAPDGHFLYVNKAWRKILGYSEKEVASLTLWDIIHPDSISHCKEVFQRVMSGETVSNVEVVFVAKDGKLVPVEGNVNCRFGGGKPVSTRGIFRDITERRRAEEALRESEEKYRKIVGNVYDMVYSLYPDGTLYFISPNVLSFTGYKPEEGIGHNIMEFIHPDDREHVLADFEKTIKTGEEFPTIFRFSRKDGSYFYAEELGRVIREGGKIVGVTGIIRDITERKKMEEALRESEERYRLLAENVTDLIWTTDMNMRFTYISPSTEHLSGYTVDETMALTLAEVLTPASLKVAMKAFAEELAIENMEQKGFFRPRTLELEFRRKDGSTVWGEVKVNFLRDPDGQAVGLLGVARDITERKKMEAQLIVADRLASIGELSSGLAHELNNPLTGIILLSELLLAKDLPDDVREDLKVMDRELQRTAGIVRNLLTFAREHETEKQAVNINGIIEKVLELRAYEQKVSNIEVNTRFAPALPEIMADGFRLQQAFINIIINAEHFMIEAHNKGTLTITTERVGNIVRASFVDDGPGIAQENLGHLFDPFFTTKEVGKGTGLGLSICYGIVTEHGGRIYAESELGKGATFIVELPIGEQ